MGDVTVSDGAAIAPGVVLQASAGSRIVIAAGACLAGGVCIQSRRGVLTIGERANLGANVLIVGSGTIGAEACISPGSTVIDPQIETSAIVPPSTLVSTALTKTASSPQPSSYQPASQSTSFQSTDSYPQNGYSQNGAATNGNTSNSGFTSGSYLPNPAGFTYSGAASSGAPPQVTVPQQSDSFVNTYVEPPPPGPKPIAIPDLSDQNGQYIDPSVQTNGVQLNNGYSNYGQASTHGSIDNGSVNNGSTNGAASNSSALSVPGNQRVYGKDQVSQLLSTLFPNRQAL